MAYAYILECRDGTYYTGSAKDLSKRLAEHRSGRGAKYTRQRLPVKLVHSEELASMSEAMRREREIQGLSRRRKLTLIAASAADKNY
jgi:putative endonuclease